MSSYSKIDIRLNLLYFLPSLAHFANIPAVLYRFDKFGKSRSGACRKSQGSGSKLVLILTKIPKTEAKREPSPITIETEAILWALEKGMLAGVGLDVLEEECVLKEERELLTKEFLKTCNLKTQLLNHVLLTKNNVIITPHNAFNSQEALIQILDATVTNITAWMNGKAQNKLI